MKNLKFLLLLSVTAFALMGCPKDPPDPNNNNNPAEEQEYIPKFDSSRGTMVAILTTYFVNVNDSLIGSSYGTARAKFYGDNFSTLVDAGTVKVRPLTQQYSPLTKKTNNLYAFEGSTGSGIQFHQQPTSEWEVTGNTTNGIPALNLVLSGFTSDPIFKGPTTTINSSSDFTVELRQNIANVDKTIFALYGKNKSIIKEAAPTVTSYTFTASEIASLGKGSAVLQIGAYRAQPFTKEGKKFVLVNEKLAAQDVVIE